MHTSARAPPTPLKEIPLNAWLSMQQSLPLQPPPGVRPERQDSFVYRKVSRYNVPRASIYYTVSLFSAYIIDRFSVSSPKCSFILNSVHFLMHVTCRPSQMELDTHHPVAGLGSGGVQSQCRGCGSIQDGWHQAVLSDKR